MAKIKIVFCLMFALLAVSCAGLSPYIKNGKTELLQYAGEEGEIVVFANVKAYPGFIAEMLHTDADSFSRFYDAVILASGDDISGALEGDIPAIGKNILVDKMNGKPAQYGDLKFYATSSNGKDLYFDLVFPGFLLFSNSQEGYARVYDRFVMKKIARISPEQSNDMQEHFVSIYGKNPVNGKNEMFSDGNVSEIRLLVDREGEKEYNLNGLIQMKDKDAFKRVNTILRSQYMDDLKRNGDKLDLEMMASCFKPSAKDFSIQYLGFKMNETLFMQMFGGGM